MKAAIQELGGNGYVWDADVAHWLRLECGLVGAMVGGVAAFKQQNAVHGLPLELSPEEVTLALERGWGELQPALGMGEAAAAAAAAAAASRKRGRDGSYANHYAEQEGEGLDGDDNMPDAAAAAQPPEPAWRAALAAGSSFTIPTTPADAAAANGTSAEAGSTAAAGAAAGTAAGAAGAAAGMAGAAAVAAAPPWHFPATREERHRYWVFRDLQAKGYRLTGGSKFGADFLLYPGDPTLFHAQFCVRLARYDAPLLPALLAAATRGSHQARKHLLLASVVEGEGGRQGDGGGGAAAAAGAATGGCVAAGEAARGAEPAAAQRGGEAAAGGESEGEAWRLGADSRGTGTGGEQFRIRYLTIGPVEGFG